MKYLLLLTLFITPAFSQDLYVRLVTDYHQKFGKVAIDLKGDMVGVAQDRNRCMPNKFGEPMACTRMAIFYTESPLKLIKVSKDKTKKLFEIEKIEKYQLMIKKDEARLVEIDLETGRTVGSYALRPEFHFN